MQTLGAPDRTLAARYNPSIRNALREAGDFAQNFAYTAFKNGQTQIEVGDNDTYSGSFGNAFESSAYGVFGGLDSMLHSEKAASAFNQAVQELADQNAIDPEFSWEYLTNPHGLTRSFGQTAGSMAATMLAMPETTAARGIAALDGSAIEQALIIHGLPNAAKVFAEGAPNAFRYAATSAPVEGLAEGGHVRTDLLNEGYSDEEATRRSINTTLANIPILAASNFAEGLLLGAPLLKTGGSIAKNVGQGVARWQLNSLQQALEESTQKGISNWQTDKPYSFNPLNYTPGQAQEFWEGYFGSLPLGIASGVSHATSRPSENAQEKDSGTQENISKEQNPQIEPVKPTPDITPVQENTSQEQIQQDEPPFDINTEDSKTKERFEQFAREKRDASEGAQAAEYSDFFSGMFTDKDKFKNTPENRNAILETYDDEFRVWAADKVSQEQPQTQ